MLLRVRKNLGLNQKTWQAGFIKKPAFKPYFRQVFYIEVSGEIIRENSVFLFN